MTMPSTPAAEEIVATHAVSEPVIRPLVRADAARYHELRLRMLQTYPDAFTSSFEEDSRKPVSWAEARIVPGVDAPHDFVLGAFVDGEMVGAVGLSVERRIKQRHKALLFGMYVVPAAAGKGIGRALLAACLERARAIPRLEQVYLTATASNDRACKLYQAAGFQTFGTEERAIKVGLCYYAKAHMALRLGGQDIGG